MCGECMSVWRGCACVVSVYAAIECVWAVGCVCVLLVCVVIVFGECK